MRVALLFLMTLGAMAQTDLPGPASILPLPDHSAPNALILWDKTQAHKVGLVAPATVAADIIWTTPSVDGSAGMCFGWASATTLGWVNCSFSLPVSDNTAIVFDDADATKKLRFEIGGFSTATTHVLTVQNQDYTIAGTDFANTFTQPQTFGAAITHGGSVLLNADNTYSSGTTTNAWNTVYSHRSLTEELGIAQPSTSFGTRWTFTTPSSTSLELDNNAPTAQVKYFSSGFPASSFPTEQHFDHLVPGADNTYDIGLAPVSFAAWRSIIGYNLKALTSFTAPSGATGVTCSGAPTASFATSGGIVTHC